MVTPSALVHLFQRGLLFTKASTVFKVCYAFRRALEYSHMHRLITLCPGAEQIAHQLIAAQCTDEVDAEYQSMECDQGGRVATYRQISQACTRLTSHQDYIFNTAARTRLTGFPAALNPSCASGEFRCRAHFPVTITSMFQYPRLNEADQ